MSFIRFLRCITGRTAVWILAHCCTATSELTSSEDTSALNLTQCLVWRPWTAGRRLRNCTDAKSSAMYGGALRYRGQPLYKTLEPPYVAERNGEPTSTCRRRSRGHLGSSLRFPGPSDRLGPDPPSCGAGQWLSPSLHGREAHDEGGRLQASDWEVGSR